MADRKCWAFLVGIDKYHDYSPLNYCVEDVLALQRLFEQVGYISVCLHDRLKSRDSRFPSKENILAELAMLLEKVDSQDLLLAYFACHGVRTGQGKPMLVAADTRRTRVDTQGICIQTELEPSINNSQAQQKVLMLDACFIGQGRGQADSDRNAFLRRVNELARGFQVLTASREDQASLEVDGLKHSIFCHFVLRGLAGEADRCSQGLIMLNDLKNYVLDGMREYTVRQGLNQEAQGWDRGNLGDFILVDYTAQPRPQIDIPTREPAGAYALGRGGSMPPLIDCLWTLNWKDQDNHFQNAANSPQRAAAFIVQARDSRLQYWLVKRLARSIPNLAKARIFSFHIPRHPMWKHRDMEEVWVDLGQSLSCAPDAKAVIDQLVALYQTQPVILALYGWQQSHRSMELQQELLNKLWCPLVEAIGLLPSQPLRSRLILFLAEEGALQPRMASNSRLSPICLAPLMVISQAEVGDWMETDAVYGLIEQLYGGDQVKIRRLIQEEIREWSDDPVKTIEQICWTFELEGISAIEAEWRLAG